MSTPQNQALFWDWTNNVITWSSPLYPGYNVGQPPVAHQASMHGYWTGVDWNTSAPYPFWKITATANSVSDPLPGGAGPGGGHCNGNWNQNPSNTNDQWFSCYVYGVLNPPASEGDVAPGGILLATANGQRRILAHLYNTATDYFSYSFVKFSPDGNYVMFTTNMNGSSRTDVFLAEMPTSGGTLPPPDTTPPTVSLSAPSNGATVSATTTVSASASDNVGVAGVQFYLDGAALGAEDTASPYSTSWDTTKSVNGSHTLTAIARDAAGNKGTSAAVTVTVSNSTADITPPTVPAGLTASAASSSQINLAWNASTDPDSPVAGYKVFRAGSQITTTTTTSYSDSGLSPSTTYSYSVSAYDAAGNNSAQSSSVSATTQASAPPPSGGLIALYHLDEPAGSTTFADSSGSGNTGSCSGSGCPTAGVAGKVGNAASFNGTSSLISVATTTALNAYPLTVVAWFKTASTSGVVGLVNKYVANSYNGYNVFLNNGSVCAWYIPDGSNYVYDGSGCTFAVPGYNDNAWHQVAYVVDASGAKLYLDAVLKGSRAWTGTPVGPTTTQNLQLGHYPGAFGGVEYYTGLLDEVRIYNSALSASDITSLYNADNVPPLDTTPPTVALTSPANNASVSGTTTVSASASDNVGVVGVQFYLDGAALGAEDTTAPYSVSWDTTKSTNGSHALTAIARDAAGNKSTSSAVIANVSNVVPDTTSPTVTITTPASGATVNGSASDNVGVVAVQFYLDGALLGNEVTAPPYATLWDTTKSTNATHSLTASARDAAGNIGASAAVQVSVSNNAGLTVTITSPAADSIVSGTTAVTAASWSGTVGVRFYVDGVQIGNEVYSVPFTVSWDTTTFSSGMHTLTAVARDLSGNVVTSSGDPVDVSNPRKRPGRH
jgi:chitodextrinase